MPDPQNDQPVDKSPAPKRRKILRWLGVSLLLLVVGLVWLNGPGLRFLAPRIAFHYLEKAGIKGTFKLSGSVTGGLSLRDLRLESEKGLALLTIDKLEPKYTLGGLRKGQLEAITIQGVHADLRLGLEPEPTQPKEKKPLDLPALVQSIRGLQARAKPIAVNLEDLSVSATKEGKPVFALASSNLHHTSGTEVFTLELGAITDPTGKVWTAQKSDILWQPDLISIQRLDPFPALSLRQLVFRTPADGQPSLESMIHLDEGIFALSTSPGFSSARLDLREGGIQVDRVAATFGAPIPAVARLTSLALELDHLLPEPTAATGTARLLLENISSNGWSASELVLDATIDAAQAVVAARANALETSITLDATAPVTRDAGKFLLGETTGKFAIADVPRLLGELAKRTPAIDPAAPVPPSSVAGNFRVSFDKKIAPTAADAGLIIAPTDLRLASPIGVKARWQPAAPVAADLSLDGLALGATYDLPTASYQGTLALDEFSSSRLDRWLAIFKVKLTAAAGLTARWSGGGEIKTGKHRGDLSLTRATWTRENVPPLIASGDVKYDWPGSFTATALNLQSDRQSIALDASLKDGLLNLSHLLWKDDQTEIAGGTATLPVPADFSKWRETLASDARPLAVSIDSRVLSLSLLKQWVPALEQLDPRSTGQLQIKVAGTYAAPDIEAKIEALDLRSPAKPDLPPADLKIQLVGRDGKLTVDGAATAPDFPAAIIKATMPFLPSRWASDPASLQTETIEATVDLPRLDLSRFTTLVPPARRVEGALSANVTARGTVGKPELKGTIKLTGGAVDFKNDTIPDLNATTFVIEADLQRIRLASLRATIAGGTLTGDGGLSLTGGKPTDLDFRLRGDHLPVVRNDLLIVRANANLRLQGNWERSTLSGTIGTVDSLFHRDIEILPIGSPFTAPPSAASVPKMDKPKVASSTMPEPFRNWVLDVALRTEEPFLARGNLATGEANGRINIRGTFGNPQPQGEIKLRDVTARLPFSTLTVRTGYVRFAPATGFDPILEIRGTAEPRPYRVDVYVYGPASNPQLVLTSNPPLPENEIMTLLATGTTTAGLENPQAASSRALQLLAEELRRGRFGNRFGEKLRPILGLLDRVDFSLSEADPYSNDAYSTATVALSDRWFVSAGMGEDGGSRVLGIWRFSFR